MPFVMKDKEAEQNANQQGQNISGTSTSFGTNLPGQTASKGPQKSSGQYQNIQNYLQANQPQAQQMAQQVGSNVEKSIGEAQTKTAALPGTVQKTTAYDPYKTLQNLGQASDAEKAAYKATKQTGGYTGPADITGLSGYGEAFTAAEKAKEQYGLAGTESGQQTLLAQAYNRPNYTQGASALDQSLMQRNEQGRQTLVDLQNKYRGLTEALNAPMTQAQQQIAASKAQAQQNIGAFQPAETQARADIIDPLSKRAAETNAMNQALYGRLTSDVTDLKLTPETMQMLGLTAGQRTYGTDISKYINPAMGDATIQNIATQADINKYNNLMNFLGTNAQELPSQEIGYQGVGANKEQLAKDIEAKQKEFENYARNKQIQSGNFNLIGAIPENSTSPTSQAYGNLWDLTQGNIPLYNTGWDVNGLINGKPIMDPNTAIWQQQLKQKAYEDLLRIVREEQDKYGYNKVIEGM